MQSVSQEGTAWNLADVRVRLSVDWECDMSGHLPPLDEIEAMFKADSQFDWHLVAFEVGYYILVIGCFLASLDMPIASVS